jgi:hypothetical protein
LPTFTAEYFDNAGDHTPAHTAEIPASSFERATDVAKRGMAVSGYAALRVSRSFLADYADHNMQHIQHEEDDGIVL